ncbi:hypothetical protein SteCoe_37054 [Stentor coeruleus]|uniref:PARP-type domain-containing protein n=1 Tax=Stentor coeruleus TaxID=5963 RepID=A0A1R2ANW3_9CILI|nr:hypothetical protein SteCoe_37054 [Stentor coeruleus]
MQMNSFIVEDSPTNFVSCTICKVQIQKQEMRVRIVRYTKLEYFHLNCYTPSLPQYIREKDLCVSKLGEENKKTLKVWLDNWNKKYFPLDSQPSSDNAISSILHNKSLLTNATRRRRILIEVFRFFDIYDLSKSLALVNKEYYNASWEPELWRFFLVRDFNIVVSSDMNFRHKYLEVYVKCCFECKKIPQENDYYISPLIKRVLCLNCKELPKFKLIFKSDIKRIFKVNANLLDLKFGKGLGGSSVVYQWILIKALRNFREKNKQFVLSKLYEELDDNCKIVRDVKDINTDYEPLGVAMNSDIYVGTDNHNKDYRKLFDFIRNGTTKIDFGKIFKNHKGKHTFNN